MSEPKIAQKGPFETKVEAGKSYLWCACGQSKTQPFCDQSHRRSEFKPVRWTAEKSETVWFCGCKHSGHKPFCDGTHETL